MGVSAPTPNALARPRPTDELISMGELAGPDRFVPAPSLLDWIRTAYLDPDGLLYGEHHAHLRNATMGCLWTTAENYRHGRRIAAQAEMPACGGGQSGKWRKARADQQLREWFGFVPDFVLTFDAIYADQADDAAFAALVDHELTHCAQAEDEFGQPKFNQATGRPLWKIRGHDVEEFVSVVQRFGIHAAGEKAVDMVIAAAQRPQIAAATVARACGTCHLKAA